MKPDRLEREIRLLAAQSRTRALRADDRWYLGTGRIAGLTSEDAYVRLEQRRIWRSCKIFVPVERLLANLRARSTGPETQ